jgi:hypothetical protein
MATDIPPCDRMLITAKGANPACFPAGHVYQRWQPHCEPLSPDTQAGPQALSHCISVRQAGDRAG